MGAKGRADRKRAGLRGEAGQSTLEFALTAVLFIPFTLFFVQVSMVLGFANYAHYAVFMSARAYLSASASKDEQVSRAKDVIEATLKRSPGSGVDKFPSLAKAQGGGETTGMDVAEPAPGDTTSDWQQGIRYTFRSKIFMVPLMGSGSGKGADAGDLQLISESFLLREPNEDECQADMSARNKGLYDNGC